MSVAAGFLAHRARFERQATTADDGAGNVLEAWAPLFNRHVGYLPQRGREALAAGRLESTTAGVVTVRRCSETTTLTASDRLVFLNPPYAGRILQIRSILPMPDSQTFELTVEEGVAT